MTQWILPTLSFLLGILLVARLLTERRAPGSAMAWLLLILLVPYAGVPLYLIFGTRKIRRLSSVKPELYDPVFVISAAAPLARAGNRVGLQATGEEAYRALLALIADARRTIHVTTFILKNDPVGREILSALEARARAGVKVRLLVDGVGSLRLRASAFSRLRAAGGQVATFLSPFRIPRLDHSTLRNHRKLVVVDGARAIVGGMNLAEEYLGPTPLETRWVDLALGIDGDAAADIDAIFRSDWEFATGERVPSQPLPGACGTETVQIVGSGPDAPCDPLYDSIVSAIFAARERVWIATPFFVPDETLAKALELAARRGVDLRILVPTRSDHLLADLCRGSYLRQIQRAGGRIFLYPRSMMHAKLMIIDKTCALTGSANLDMRSLLLNYEIGAFLFSPESIEASGLWFTLLSQDSTERPLRAPGWLGYVEGLARMLGPML